MKKIIRLTENDLVKLVNKVLSEQEEESYHEKVKINGIVMSVGFDGMYGDYTIYFPQIDFDNDRGVADQVIRISKNPDTAKKMFGLAKNLAKGGMDVYDIYTALEALR